MQTHKTNRLAREYYSGILTVLWWGRRSAERAKWLVGLAHSLPMSFFDDEEFRKTVLFTAECASNYIGT